MRLAHKVILIIIITVTSIIISMFYVIANHFDSQVEEHLLTTARAVYNNILMVRKWVSDKEGVFTVKQKNEKINPFLHHPELFTDRGDTLLLKNPALVTRELSKLSNSMGKEFTYHLSSLNYINPTNKPDAFEKEALLFFEKQTENKKEFYHYENKDSSLFFRYFAPLYTEESCLSCHAKQGYKLGDVRGGISIMLPAEKHRQARKEHLIFFIIIALLAILFLSIPMFIAIKRSLIKPLNKITTSVQQIQEGDYNSKLEMGKNDEIGNLALAFDDMRKKIKEYTNQLIESEKKYRSLIENSIEAVSIVNSSGEIIECNSKLSHMTGYKLSEMKLKYLDDLIDYQNKKVIQANSRENDSGEHFETILSTKSQLSIPVEINILKGFSLGTDKNLSFVYIRDLSERKKIEQYSLQTEKMFALGQISSGIAHEIRNPLFALKNNLDYLNSKFGKSESFKEIYPEIKSATERIENIVSAILDYARPHEMAFKDILIDNVINKSLMLVQKQFEKSAIKIETYYAHDHFLIEADPHKLEQVFINLFLNSFQAMSKAGILKIVTKVLNGHLKIQIEDTGTGIPAEDIKNIFDPFYSKSPNGTGLGMAIVQRILEQHNAHYWIKSEVGFGTTFNILFHQIQD